jgi:hypothetical protein
MKKKRNLREYFNQRRNRRRLAIIGSAILFTASSFLPDLLGNLLNTPHGEWYKMPIYYIVAFILVALIFILLWLWAESGERDDIDKLIERIDKGFEKQSQSINHLSKSINKLSNKIVKDKKHNSNENQKRKHS